MPSCDMDPNVLEINDICVINEFYYADTGFLFLALH